MNYLLQILASMLGGVLTSLTFMWLFPPAPLVDITTSRVDFDSLPEDVQKSIKDQFKSSNQGD